MTLRKKGVLTGGHGILRGEGLLVLGCPVLGVVKDIFDPGRWSVHPISLSGTWF
jgi:hypothetical protein